MCNFFVLLVMASFFFSRLQAAFFSEDLPIPFFQSVNLLTGHISDSSQDPSLCYAYYRAGQNQIGSETLHLTAGDSRIGKVKSVIYSQPNSSSPLQTHFLYFDDHTEIRTNSGSQIVYRYSKDGLLTSIEHSTSQTLYRVESLFWETSRSEPLLMSRVLENGEGAIEVCETFTYHPNGQLARKTLYGNLSGSCTTPLLIHSDGQPKPNGIESYSISYLYDPQHPDLICQEQEDNGKTTTYEYDIQSKKLTSRLMSHQKEIFARYFYQYDKQKRLVHAIIDNGQTPNQDDLNGASYRHVLVYSYADQTEYPIRIEKKYWDFDQGQEMALEQIRLFYTNDRLNKQEFYDKNGTFRYHLEFKYDEQNHLMSTTDSRGETAKASSQTCRYNGQKRQAIIKDLTGNEIKSLYDPFGRPIQTTYPAVLDIHDHPIQFVTHQKYDLADRLIYQKEAEGEDQTFTYNVRNQPIKIGYADGSCELYYYQLDGQLKEKISKSCQRDAFKCDPFGRITQAAKYAPDGTCLRRLNCQYQGPLLVEMQDDQGLTTELSYDAAGRLTSSKLITPDGIRHIQRDYDATGLPCATQEWFGPHEEDFISKIEQRDFWQNVVETHLKSGQGDLQRVIPNLADIPETDFLFSHAQSKMNNRCQWTEERETVDKFGTRTIETYDALGRIEKITKFDHLGLLLAEIDYRHDHHHRKVLERHAIFKHGSKQGSYSMQWIYDAAGHLIAIQEGVGSPQQKNTYYHYNSNELLEKIIKPSGIAVIYSYYPTGALASLEASDQSILYQYIYDDQQRLIQVQDLIHGNGIRREYDSFNQLKTEQLNHLFLHYTYDLSGRKTSLTLPDQSKIRYHYRGCLLDRIERLSATHNSLYQHQYTYDLFGKITKTQAIGQQGHIDYEYDAQGRLSQISSPWWNECIPSDGYDAYQQVAHLQISDSGGSYTQSFTYTDDHQLASEAGLDNQQYTYDSLYNRANESEAPWIFSDAQELLQTSHASYDYDANGNLIQKKTPDKTWHYHYDALDRLTRVECDHDYAVDYLYDPFYRRLAKIHSNWDSKQNCWTRQSKDYFIYDGEKEIGRADETGRIQELRVLGIGKGAEIGAAIALELLTETYLPIHDRQGSLRCLVDLKNGQAVECYRYSAYGLETILNGEGEPQEVSKVGNPWRFSSKRLDSESGLIAFGKRYYDPQIGRWTTPDPLFFFDCPNRYAFVQNNPTNAYDLYGLFSISSIWSQTQETLTSGYQFFQEWWDYAHQSMQSGLKLGNDSLKAFERIGKNFLGERIFLLVGDYFEKTESGRYGRHDLSDKIRITFINGILTNQNGLIENLEMISQSHGNSIVHYIFRPTEGWMVDIYKAFLVKMAFMLGFRSIHAHLLARKWKELIAEMGGTNGGGAILHYAHSLGGSETDRARNLLSPEEQKMIRVISFGSATMIRDEGFASVVNYVSVNDGVPALDPLGFIRNQYDDRSNVRYERHFLEWPIWPIDHLLTGSTYKPILMGLGDEFVRQFNPI